MLIICLDAGFSYNQLFGWKIDKSSESVTLEGMEYWIVTTTDDKGNKALVDGMSKSDLTAANNQFHRRKIDRRILV
jgi:hypothetical protein